MIPGLETRNEKTKSKGVFMTGSNSPLDIQTQGTSMNNKHGKFDSQPRLPRNKKVDLLEGHDGADPIVEVSNQSVKAIRAEQVKVKALTKANLSALDA